MATVPYPYQPEPAPSTFPHLLINVCRRLYPDGDDPVYQVYREQLANGVYEYHAEVIMHNSTVVGTYTRSTKGGTASTPDQAVQFAAFEALTDLRYNEIQMQTHPGFYFYPSLYESGQIRFPYINPECDRSASHLSRYITAGYFLITSIAQELDRVRGELAAARSAFAPPLLTDTSLVPPATLPPPTPVTPTPSQNNSGTLVVAPHESPA